MRKIFSKILGQPFFSTNQVKNSFFAVSILAAYVPMVYREGRGMCSPWTKVFKNLKRGFCVRTNCNF